ncbi:HAMP domain-containing histidine kinase [Thermosynechococcus sp. HN-54]|nr:HAMP domain-containing histidine kinase [Thermosynechococcus sp. HN-54]
MTMVRAIQYRLALWYVGVTALLLLIFATGFFFYVRGTLIERIDDTLSHVVEVVSRSLIIDTGTAEAIDWQTSLGSSPLAALEEDHIDLEGFTPDQQLAWSTFSEPLDLPLHPSRTAETVQVGEDRWLRQMTVALVVGDRLLGYLRVSHPWFEVTQPSQALLWDLLVGITITLTLVSISGWFLSRLAIAPLQQSYAYLKQFTADASHELRNPVALIQTNVQVALATADPETQRQQLLVIERLSRRLSRLVDDLLFLARQDSGMIPLQAQPCHLDAILLGVIEEQTPLIQQKQLQLVLELADPQTSAAEAYRLWGNPDHLSRLLTNILSNAVQYTPAGGQIQVMLDQQGKFYRMVIADNGPGIPASDLPRLFDRFYRLQGTKSEGTGLGLAIAQSIVEAHRGQIQVTSEVGQGTCFTILLPAEIKEI